MKAPESKALQKDIRKWWLKNITFIVFTALILFTLSGTLTWAAAWIYLALILIIVIANAIAMDPSLMAERARLQEGTKRWDLILATFVVLWGPLSMLVVAGLDQRYSWSQNPAPGLQVAAAILFLLGGLMGTWAMAANRYFSGTVRIQEERGHAVVNSGPYRIVRHPGYAGGILSTLMVPLLLESWFTFIPAALVAGAFIARTVLEDRVLKNELAGYSEYSRHVCYRLFPGLW